MKKKRSECTCSCHTQPTVMHIAPCCYPDEYIERMSRYYHPAIEDIRVGYECFWIVDPIKPAEGDNLMPVVLNEKAMAMIFQQWMSFHDIRNGIDRVNIMSYLTPYLTKEQIEGEGWIFWKQQEDVLLFRNEGDYLFLRYSPESKQLNINNYFIGNCPSINEFRMISKLLTL